MSGWFYRWFLPSRLEDFLGSGQDEEDIELGLLEGDSEEEDLDVRNFFSKRVCYVEAQ